MTIIHVAVLDLGEKKVNQWGYTCLCNGATPNFGESEEHWYEAQYMHLAINRPDDTLCPDCTAHPDYPLILLGAV